MSDSHALVGAYAVDALDADERSAFEQHLAGCDACRAELADLQETAALLGAAEATPPPAGLRDRVLAGVDTVRPLPPATGRPGSAPSHRRFRPAVLVAAAAVVVALGAGAVAWQPWADETSEAPRVTVADRVRAAADAEVMTWTVDGGVEATLVRSRELNQAVLVTTGMPAPPDGKVYELWLDHEGIGMVPAGLMTGDEREVVLEGDPATAVGFGITVEPAGGSEEPTPPAVTTISFENT